MTQTKDNNISDNKKLEIQKYIALGELTTSISHELSNLLEDIDKTTKIAIEKNEKNESITNELDNIKKSSDLSKNVFKELFEFSKASGHIQEKKPVNINNIIEEVLLILKVNKNITFKIDFDNSITPLNLIRQKIKQVVINIIMNGIDACQDNKPVISITTGKLQFYFGFFIKITDNGKGIPENVKKQLFKPFFTTKKTGTGLGLSVCNDIIKEHNGSIKVFSEPGKGSTFIINFLLDSYNNHPDIIDL